MRIPTKIRYGLRAMIEIDMANESGGILLKDISVNQKISNKYLDSIISSLKVKGLILNVKGKGSGYKLARPANEITMLDIYTAFDTIVILDCVDNKNYCEKACDCDAKEYWSEFKEEFIGILSKKNLAQIVKKPVKFYVYENQSKAGISHAGSNIMESTDGGCTMEESDWNRDIF